jgi:hypothetical protein
LCRKTFRLSVSLTEIQRKNNINGWGENSARYFFHEHQAGEKVTKSQFQDLRYQMKN